MNPEDTEGAVGVGWDIMTVRVFGFLLPFIFLGTMAYSLGYLDWSSRYALVNQTINSDGFLVMEVCNDLSCSGNTQGCPHVRSVCDCSPEDRIYFRFDNDHQVLEINNGMLVDVKWHWSLNGWRIRGVKYADIN